MPPTIPSLWPKEFDVNVQTPLTILRVQANLLGQVTKGILDGVVETETSKERVQHRLVVIAPAYNGYRFTLVTALHDADLPYPAEVRAEALAEKRKVEIPSPVFGLHFETVYPIAHDDKQMAEFVSQALQSQPTKAAILSLIANSNEVRSTPSAVLQSPKADPNGSGQESRSPTSGTDPKPMV